MWQWQSWACSVQVQALSNSWILFAHWIVFDLPAKQLDLKGYLKLHYWSVTPEIWTLWSKLPSISFYASSPSIGLGGDFTPHTSNWGPPQAMNLKSPQSSFLIKCDMKITSITCSKLGHVTLEILMPNKVHNLPLQFFYFQKNWCLQNPESHVHSFNR